MEKAIVNVRVPIELKEWYQERAEKEGTSMSVQMMYALRDYRKSTDLIEELGGETMVREALKKRLKESE